MKYLKRLMKLKVFRSYILNIEPLEGIATLEIVLKANGYAPFLLQRNGDDDMVQVFENEDDVDKPKYAMWVVTKK